MSYDYSHFRPASPKCPQHLRTLQIGNSWSIDNGGGAERIFTMLARHLAAQGIAFTGVVSGPTDLSEATHGMIHSFSPEQAGIAKRWLGARRTIAAILDSSNPDLVVSHFAMYISAAFDKIKNLPHVVHFHGPWAAESFQEGDGQISTGAKYYLEKTVYKRAQHVIVLSKAFAELARRDYGIEEKKLSIVPGAVDTEHFDVNLSRTQARARLGWPTDRPIFVTVRRLSNRMGLDLLIEAMTIVKAARPDALLYICGQGSQRLALQHQVGALGLYQHVRFMGFIADDLLPLAYRAADINVVPTRALEGFGLVAAEALAAGTPSMVTPVGGLPEVVSLLSPELIFRACTVQDIADGLIQALSGGIKLPGEEACRQHAAEHFSGSLMAARTARVYRDVLNTT